MLLKANHLQMSDGCQCDEQNMYGKYYTWILLSLITFQVTSCNWLAAIRG